MEDVAQALGRFERIPRSNPKSEILRKSQNLNPNNSLLAADLFRIWRLGFPSDFGFRIF
jgi:hypothetical protein